MPEQQPWLKTAETILRSFGIPVVPTSDGNTIEGDIPLPAQVVHPFTGQALQSAHFMVVDERNLRFVSPAVLRGIKEIPYKTAVGQSSIANAVGTALLDWVAAIEGWKAQLERLHVRTQRIDETGEIIANFELIERGTATMVLRAEGVVLSHFIAARTNQQTRIGEVIDLSIMDDQSDLGLYLDAVVDKYASAAPAMQIERTPAHGFAGGFDEDSSGAVSGSGYGTSDGAFLAEVTTPVGANNLPELPANAQGPTLDQLREFFGGDTQLPAFESRSVQHISGRVLGVSMRMTAGRLVATVHESGKQIFGGEVPANAGSLFEWVSALIGEPAAKPTPFGAQPSFELEPQSAGLELDLQPVPVQPAMPEMAAMQPQELDMQPLPVDPEPMLNRPERIPGLETGFGMAPVTAIEAGSYWRMTVQADLAEAPVVRYIVLDHSGAPFGNHVELPNRDFHVLFQPWTGGHGSRVRVTGVQDTDVLYVHVDATDRMLSNPIALDKTSFSACFTPA